MVPGQKNLEKFPALYESFFANYERGYDKPFFWKNGKLF
jgi:hypothetical protein